MKRCAPASERNRDPIREVLVRHLPASGVVLEIASGSGEHAIFMAKAFPALSWQPTDADPGALASITAWRAEADLPNVLPALALDVTGDWPVPRADAIVCINMVHIAPWEAALALFAGAERVLASGTMLYLYGPYRFHGAFTAPSNADFDRSLRARDPRWAVRDVDDLEAAATARGLRLADTISMPANNHSLIFRRT
jgi:hypothetical protein